MNFQNYTEQQKPNLVQNVKTPTIKKIIYTKEFGNSIRPTIRNKHKYITVIKNKNFFYKIIFRKPNERLMPKSPKQHIDNPKILL